VSPDPLVALADTNKALRSRLLAEPTLRDRYLRYVADIAERWLDWTRMEPKVTSYRALIDADVSRDTRKLASTEAFRASAGVPGDTASSTLRAFMERRRAALLNHPAVRAAAP
jgi:hypothetical protein